MLNHFNQATFKDEYWMTSDEAQQFFKVSRSTLYRWCKTKQLPYAKQGGVLYYPKIFIEHLMKHKMQNNF